MQLLLYDGSFAGLLTAVFDTYEYKYSNASIRPTGTTSGSLFSEPHTVTTDQFKAKRVWSAMEQYLGPHALRDLSITLLSELPGIEDHILHYIQHLLQKKRAIDRDFSHPAVLAIFETAKKVRREKHRMEAFVRFHLTKDNLYYAIIQPDFHVLPLISNHFEKRYADQRWLIYDSRRKCGIYYDLNKVEDVQMEFSGDLTNAETLASIHDEKEELYQVLWTQYFESVNIGARKNLKLHVRHMPKRYWKFLPEKYMKSIEGHW